MYKCLECGKETEIVLKTSRKVQCAYCGYRILRKMRPLVPVRVQAR